jgi:single-strand DNA-binding protein
MYNKVTLIGYLGKDAQSFPTSKGGQIIKLNLATSKNKKVDDEWVEHTSWHSVVLFGKMAEKYGNLQKGQGVMIEGELSYNKYEKDGETKYSTDIVANLVVLVEKKESKSIKQQKPTEIDLDDEIPF